MKKTEYLILHYALTYTPFLREVFDDYNISFQEMISIANNLFQNGDIVAFKTNDEPRKAPFIPTQAQIESHLSREIGMLYGLTPQGGARWSAITHPNWNKYIYESSFSLCASGELNQKTYICVERKILEKFLSVENFFSSGLRIRGTEVWDVLEPWNVTYWKQLPRGERVVFNYKSHPATPINEETMQAYQEACLWYNDIWNWYTKPEFKG
jgi:hypothetical protein